jgi:hypothetical protein
VVGRVFEVVFRRSKGGVRPDKSASAVPIFSIPLVFARNWDQSRENGVRRGSKKQLSLFLVSLGVSTPPPRRSGVVAFRRAVVVKRPAGDSVSLARTWREIEI